MNENSNTEKSSISKAGTSEEVGDYWDSHSLADHWDQTQEVDFESRVSADGVTFWRLGTK